MLNLLEALALSQARLGARTGLDMQAGMQKF